MRKLVVILLLLVSLPSFAQVDKREVRKGNRLFKKEKIDASEIEYRKAVLKDSTSVAAEYDLASALYKGGKYDEASQALSRVKDAASESEYSTRYHYNCGNVAVQKKDYAAAVEAYKKALLEDPSDFDAKENYIYAKLMLQNQQDNQGQDNQNQDQNKDQNQNQDQQNQQQNPQDNKDNQDQQQPQPQEQKISQQQAQQMLKAIQAQEKKTQEKVDKEKAAALKSSQKEKNW